MITNATHNSTTKMSFWFFIISFSLVTLAVVGLVMAQIAAKEQDRIISSELRERKIALKLQDMIDLYPNLLSFFSHSRLLQLWLERTQDLLGEFSQTPTGKDQQAALQELISEWQLDLSSKSEQDWHAKPLRAPETDSELRVIQKICVRLQRLMDNAPTLMSGDERSMLKEWLQVFTLRAELSAYEFQGHFCADQGDRSGAVAYFKHAKDKLLANKLAYEQRTEDIKRLSKAITSVYISHDEEDEGAAPAPYPDLNQPVDDGSEQTGATAAE